MLNSFNARQAEEVRRHRFCDASLTFLIGAALLVLIAGRPAAAGECGDGELGMGEQCEAPFSTCCDPATCTFRPSDTTCRFGSGDSCDPNELCSGTSDQCPEDVFSDAGLVCRAGGAQRDGVGFVCDATEYCSGVPGEPCPQDLNHDLADAVVLRAAKDTKMSRRHDANNYGAGGLIHLRGDFVRGLVGFDLSCGPPAAEKIDCALLETSIHDAVARKGRSDNEVSKVDAYILDADWSEGNAAFDDFKWGKGKIGPHAGSGAGTTWTCSLDYDLVATRLNHCSEEERWAGAEDCSGSPCYRVESLQRAYLASREQEKLTWDVTAGAEESTEAISWMFEVGEEEGQKAPLVRFYTREGAKLIAEWDGTLTAREAFSMGPRMLMLGSERVAPVPHLVEPAHRLAHGAEVSVHVDQTGDGLGAGARWENETLGSWGYLEESLLHDWQATIPLAEGANVIHLTVYDRCGTQGTSTHVIESSIDTAFCGNGSLEEGEECDDGNAVGGDCCSGSCQIDVDESPCDDRDTCSPVSTCQAGICVGESLVPGACGTSYMCYAGVSDPRKVPLDPLSFETSFGEATVGPRRPAALCVAGAVEGETLSAPTTQSMTYSVKQELAAVLPVTAAVTDRFGRSRLQIGRAGQFFAPAGMAWGEAAIEVAPALMDSRVCFDVKLLPPRSSETTEVAVQDIFGAGRYLLRRPVRLCVAAGLPESGPQNPREHLLCYSLRRARGESPHVPVRDQIHLVDTIGARQFDTRGEKEFCTPAEFD